MTTPRIIIINCFSDKQRGARGNPLFVPQSMACAVLAGQLDACKVDIKVHCEFQFGPFADFDTLRWAQLLVLTGLNSSFDRMKQITAYARTVNPGIAVAMGGPLARALPHLSRRYFDFVCEEDVEQIVDVVREAFGQELGAAQPLPRYDLTHWSRQIGFAESSRNCNFHCDFCSMTAEGRRHTTYELDYLRRQVESMGRRACVMFLDQNFYGGNRAHFARRIELLKALRAEGKIGGWAALVTADFFNDPANLRMARESGCIGFFCGVESFSRAQIAAFRKKQNLILPQEEVIRRSLDAGLAFHYGMVFDPTERRIDELEAEVELIADNPRIPPPSFLSLVIPLLGTPLFHARLAEGSLLPDLKLRDMDGRSLVCHTLDDLDRATAFVARLDRGAIPRRKLALHASRFLCSHRGGLKGWALVSTLTDYWAMAFPGLGTNGRERGLPGNRRSFLSTTEPLGSLYQPVINVPTRYMDHFRPLMVTGAQGELHEDVAHDLSTSPAMRRAARADADKITVH